MNRGQFGVSSLSRDIVSAALGVQPRRGAE
jgi:hypothetical protein